MNRVEPTEWQLPRGVTRGVWQYAQADFVAHQYDRDLAGHSLTQLDLEIVLRHRPATGVVVDLGCGTGRTLLPLVRGGLQGLAVDLSQPMLSQVQQKAQAEGLPIVCLRANLVELDCLADQSVDYALCLFSTLGMVQGHAHRQAVLEHARRLLRPGGKLVLHVHNYWFHIFDPSGPWWLLSNLLGAAWPGRPRGDRQYDYQGIRNFYLHVFTWRELCRLLRRAGLEIVERTAVGTARQGRLLRPWLFGGCRASGWVVVCQKPHRPHPSGGRAA